MAVLVVGATAALLLRPLGGPLVEHRYPAGGFTLTIPSRWRLHLRESADEPWSWIEADRPTRLGPPDAWLWLNRTHPGGRDPLATIRRYSLADVHTRWGDVHVTTERTTFAGNPALRMRFSHPYIRKLSFLPTGDVDEVRFITARAGEVYELGVAGWPGIPDEARDLEQLLHLAAPRGVRTMTHPTSGFRISVPAAWNRGQTPRVDMPDAVLIATAASDPPSAWVIVWQLEEPVETAVEQSASKAAREGAVISSSATRLAGAPATRIDFWKKAGQDRVFCSTWIFSGPDGRAWQLLVGSTNDDPSAATKIAATAAFRYVSR
jgi:hypothetical protein